jgi:CMP-N,N'-diacetyllegionaminic acid synthase
MIANRRVTAIIPARGGSKRLKRKNIVPVWGRPMLSWAVRAAQHSKYIDDIFVSSEDPKILRIARESGARIIRRPKYLAADHVFKQDVIVHAVRFLQTSRRQLSPDIVVSLQPNSPEILPKHLDKAIEKLLADRRQEVLSVDAHLNQNAAFRIMTSPTVFQRTLSTFCGVIIVDIIDVNTPEDLHAVSHRKKPSYG